MKNSHKSKDAEPLPTTPEQLFTLLGELGITYKRHDHPPVFTVEESSAINADIAGTHCRNLYVRDKKKKNFLIVAANDTNVDLKAVQERVGAGRFSFGSADRLWQFLGIRPGSVTPFTLINDPEHDVTVILDEYMMAQDMVNYHPLDNSMTISLTPADLLKFLDHTGHDPFILELDS